MSLENGFGKWIWEIRLENGFRKWVWEMMLIG